MKTMKLTLISILGISLVLVSGCMNLKLWKKTVDIQTFMITTEDAEPLLTTPLADKLWIDNVTVLPPFNARNLIQRKSDVEFAASYYSELLMSPSENFRNEFFGRFANSGIFRDVSIVDRAGMSHRMVVSVMEFYADVQAKEAVLKIKVTLLDEKTNGVRVLMSTDYRQVSGLADTTAEELIRAYNKALAQILADAEKDVAAALKPSAEK